MSAPLIPPAEDLETLCAQISGEGTWSPLLGASSSRGGARTPRAAGASAAELDEVALVQEGYAASAALVSRPLLDAAREAIDQIVCAGWPPVFALLSDALWDVLGAPELADVMRQVHGPGAKLRPGLWVKRVEEGGAGWPPHVDVTAPDGVDAAGHPQCLTGFLALSDVSVHQACIHIVPRGSSVSARAFAAGGAVSSAAVLDLLHRARAVPVPAGAVTLWARDLVHWCGRHSDSGAPPRVSVAFETACAEAARAPGAPPAMLWGTRPEFVQRLGLVAYNLMVYGADAAREPGLERFVAAARALRNPGATKR